MSLIGNPTQRSDQPPYFKSLEELDQWAKAPVRKLDGVLKYIPRSVATKSGGKLLVCHDYKGGYTEKPTEMSYTFNYWSLCTSFIYFSHHRVTVPPPGWITAAHRQGVKMLGTIIFEGGAEPDCLRLLVGQLPKSNTAPAESAPVTGASLPISPHYATILADLAVQRGFDGYLLNFECPLQGRVEQTQALAAWITILQSELQAKVGPHAETIWYDSVIIDGRLAWQDRLNSLNLPFFLSSTGFFTNYTWRNNYPNLTAQYFLTLDSSLTGNSPTPNRQTPQKSLNDIFMGVDVWGRGSHGGGGFGLYKAISHIAPETLGLSVALFGQAWTWESQQDKPGFTWESWWAYDRTLWVGSMKDDPEISVPEAPTKRGEPDCTHGVFLPIASFFPRSPPPNPLDLPLHTTFSPGVGRAWFVNGIRVFQSSKGWTDIEKQCSVGDLVWPRPLPVWEGGEWDEEPPLASSELYMNDAWNGGNSLRVKIQWKGSESETAAYRCVWIPIQSVALTPHQSYDATMVYKMQATGDEVLEVGLSAKSLENASGELEILPQDEAGGELAGGWMKLSSRLVVSGSGGDTSVAVGLVVAIMAEDPSQPVESSILFGQLNVSPTAPAGLALHSPRLLWADYEPLRSSPGTHSGRPSGVLTWQVATSCAAVNVIGITSPEDPVCAWQPHPAFCFPTFMYFNIYKQPFLADNTVGTARDAVWIGTSGWDGLRNWWVFKGENKDTGKKVRFYVQGVTDRGEVLGWDLCVRVDVTLLS